jgi:hypothetical protein
MALAQSYDSSAEHRAAARTAHAQPFVRGVGKTHGARCRAGGIFEESMAFFDDDGGVIKTSRVGNCGALAPAEETRSAALETRSIESSDASTYVLFVVYFLYERYCFHPNDML